MTQPEVKKIVLAYSGGLDTSVIVPWLKENYPGSEVVCYCANIGQDDDMSGLNEKALHSGAAKCMVEDLREEFAKDYLFKLVQSSAIYERRYLLGTSIARPLIATHQVRMAEAEGADAVAHGCTGKGNDQVRFELTFTGAQPAAEGHRTLARMAHPLARGRARLRPRCTTCPCRPRSSPSTRATVTCGTCRTRAASWKTRPASRTRHVPTDRVAGSRARETRICRNHV